QRRVVALLARVRIGAALEQQLQQLAIALRRGGMHRRDEHRVPRRRRDVRAALDQEPRDLGMAEKDRQAEGVETVVAEGVEEGGVGVEQLAQARQIAERRGLVKRQEMAAIEEELH